MYHSFFTWCKLNECSKLFDADDFSFQNLSGLKVSNDCINELSCLLHSCCVCSADRYCTIVCNINLHTCLLNDRIDCLSSLTDNITDLLRIDLHLDNLRCVFSDLSSWLIDCFGHNLIHDVKSCFSCLCNCLFNDGSCQSVNLDIHLDSCDTFMCSGYLEVHISEEVFQSLDICQYKVIIISITCYKSTGDSCYCRFDWYTCCHQSHRRCTYTCL